MLGVFRKQQGGQRGWSRVSGVGGAAAGVREQGRGWRVTAMTAAGAVARLWASWEAGSSDLGRGLVGADFQLKGLPVAAVRAENGDRSHAVSCCDLGKGEEPRQ